MVSLRIHCQCGHAKADFPNANSWFTMQDRPRIHAEPHQVTWWV
ncbi:hypothetical protein KNP414_02139 [Paenibacillus mucilaginosus KNP414]|uniref:Uncharacterized protein n=1 Tax=Paenibacillus mucilaginosus (strain KNP414) TaxID=1036673 RepID=F8F4X0_PAEMK|nr:hypothetical protein KNP414_02139 [Paenibacillus mucilaginosus KNP414]